jgi:hypothetical protein
MAKAFNGEYVKTATLGKFSDGREIQLGHYKEGKTEYADKVYIISQYTTKAGEEKTAVKSTNLTLKDLAELQDIDLSEFDTESDAKELFD